MTRPSLRLRELALNAANRFLIPVARFLLRHDVTFEEFAAVSQRAFVQAALEHCQGKRRPTASSVAAVTGIPRRTCRKIMDSVDPLPDLNTATVWAVPLVRPPGSARTFVDDIELGRRATLIVRFGERLSNLASTLDHNYMHHQAEQSRFEATVSSTRLDPALLPSFKRVLAERGLHYLHEMDSWLSSHEIGTSGANRVSVEVSIYSYLSEGA